MSKSNSIEWVLLVPTLANFRFQCMQSHHHPSPQHVWMPPRGPYFTRARADSIRLGGTEGCNRVYETSITLVVSQTDYWIPASARTPRTSTHKAATIPSTEHNRALLIIIMTIGTTTVIVSTTTTTVVSLSIRTTTDAHDNHNIASTPARTRSHFNTMSTAPRHPHHITDFPMISLLQAQRCYSEQHLCPCTPRPHPPPTIKLLPHTQRWCRNTATPVASNHCCHCSHNNHHPGMDRLPRVSRLQLPPASLG